MIEKLKEICGKDSEISLNPQSKIEPPEADEPGVGGDGSPSGEVPEPTRPTQSGTDASTIAILEKEISLLREQNTFLQEQIESLRKEKEVVSNQLSQLILTNQLNAQKEVILLAAGQEPSGVRLSLRQKLKKIFSKNIITEETVED